MIALTLFDKTREIIIDEKKREIPKMVVSKKLWLFKVKKTTSVIKGIKINCIQTNFIRLGDIFWIKFIILINISMREFLFNIFWTPSSP